MTNRIMNTVMNREMRFQFKSHETELFYVPVNKTPKSKSGFFLLFN